MWHFEIYNPGVSDGDNMIRQTITALNGSCFEVLGLYVNDGETLSWMLNDTHAAMELSCFISAGDVRAFDILFQPGCDPVRLCLSAEADNGGLPIPFNDLYRDLISVGFGAAVFLNRRIDGAGETLLY